MTSLPDSVLVESISARSQQMASLDDSRATEVLNKASSIIFAMWQGTGIATNEQIADYYETSVDTIKKVVQRHRDEFESDGLKTIKGKELKEVVALLSLRGKITVLTVWSPKAALKLGLYLQSSLVGYNIREIMGIPVTCSLAFKEVDIERLACKEFGGQRQKRLLSQKRIDICDGILIWEVKRGQATARHVGQLFEYMHETGLREGRLIAASFSSDAKALCKALQKSGYIVELYLYNR